MHAIPSYILDDRPDTQAGPHDAMLCGLSWGSSCSDCRQRLFPAVVVADVPAIAADYPTAPDTFRAWFTRQLALEQNREIIVDLALDVIELLGLQPPRTRRPKTAAIPGIDEPTEGNDTCSTSQPATRSRKSLKPKSPPPNSPPPATTMMSSTSPRP